MDVLHFIKSYHDEVRAALDALERASGTQDQHSCLDEVSRLAQVYLTLERDYLYPEISDLFPGAAQLVQLGETHGANIARRLKNLANSGGPESEGYDLRLAEMREALLEHFASEEQILMPKMRSMIRTEEREDLGQVFLDAREEVLRMTASPSLGASTADSSEAGVQRKRA